MKQTVVWLFGLLLCAGVAWGQPSVSPGGAAASGGDVTRIWDCNAGACDQFVLPDESIIDMRGIDVQGNSVGFYFPDEDDCSFTTGQSQACWDTTNNQLCIGSGSASVCWGASGAGDIESVFGCASGACTDITVADGQRLNFSSVNPTTDSEGLVLPQGTTVTSATAEGQVSWKTDTDDLWIGDSSTVTKIGPLTLDQTYDQGKEIDGANSQANAVVIGDGTDGIRFYVGASGPVQECFIGAGTCDQRVIVASGNDFILTLNGTDALTISSAGAVTLGEPLEETKVLMVPAGMMVVDGTQCTSNSDQTLGSETFKSTITCTDNDAAIMRFDFPAPAAWDEAELTITAHMFQTDASPDGNINIDWSGYCAGHNDAYGTNTFTAETANGAMDFAASAVAQNDLIVANTTGQVPIGSCTEGDMVRIRGAVDATGTTAATPEDVHILWVVVKLAFNDWSN